MLVNQTDNFFHKNIFYLFITLFITFGCDKSTEPKDEEDKEPVEEYSIQGEINKAEDGDTVLVEPGTYKENLDFMGKNIILASLFLTKDDTSYIESTVIDGTLSGSVVTLKRGEDSTAAIIGLTITNGLGSSGGGIYCSNASPRLENLILIENSASGSGGGIYCYNTPSMVIKNITLIGNRARTGGGICCVNSSLNVENVTIINNGLETGTFAITCGEGGGIYCSNSNATFKNITISENSCRTGGGVFVKSSAPTFMNVTLSGNIAFESGGGLYCSSEAEPRFENIIMSNNSADGNGGGVLSAGNSNPNLVNVVVTGNTSNSTGRGAYITNSSLTLMNTIVWGDSLQDIHFPTSGEPSSITISYSDIQGGEDEIVTNDNGTVEWLEGNITDDPLFEDSENGGFRLQEGSPCIDTGNPDAEYHDPDGSTNDMGAYGGSGGAW